MGVGKAVPEVELVGLVRWRIVAGCLIAASLGSPRPAGAAQHQQPTFVISAAPIVWTQAPADMYFGAYRLSNLSVRNAIHDMEIEGNSPLALPGQIERIAAVQSALAQWALRYPHDPWLPGTMLDFAMFLHGKQLPQYDRVALALFDELALSYPERPQGRAARTELESFALVPQVDLSVAPGIWPVPTIFEVERAGIGANRPHHFL